jgi:ComEC/Rec2-related protein
VEIDNVRFERKSIFSRRPALLALLFYLAGILVSTYIRTGYLIPLCLVLASLVTVIYFYSREAGRQSAWAAAVLLLFMGWLNASLSIHDFPPNHIAHLAGIGGRVELIGRVVEEPDIRKDRTYLVVEVDSVLLRRTWIPSGGKIRARINNGGSRYDHADVLELTGYLYRPGGSRNPGGFDYGAYLRTKGVFAAMSVSGPRQVVILEEGSSFLAAVIRPLRNYLIARSNEYLTPVSAAILSGFILGERRDIPEEYQTLFRDTGTLHLMAVSGSNVALVVAVFAFPMAWLGIRRKIRVLILLAVILFFALLTRLEPSVVRASIMASIGLVAYGWMRKPDYIGVLAFAGLLMLIWKPMQVFDVGLQLSFAAAFAIIYVLSGVSPYLSRLKKKSLRWVLWFVSLLLSTMAAQAAVMPLLSRYFNNLPLVGILANIPVGLLATVSSVGGIAFYFSTIIGAFVAAPLAGFLGLVLNAVKDILGFFASLPYANLKVGSPGWLEILLYWSALYVVFEAIVRRRVSSRGIMIAVATFCLIIWTDLFQDRPSWRVEFLDVGRNRAWIYSDLSGTVAACYDSYTPRDDPYNTLVRQILNYYGGRLDYLFTSTEDSKAVLELRELFSPALVTPGGLRQMSRPRGSAGMEGRYNLAKDRLPANIKVVWDESDNREEEKNGFPVLRIDVGEEVLLFAAWSNTGLPGGYRAEKRIGLVEMPWSVYARTSSRRQIRNLDPQVVVFSADRLTVAAPRRRSELTYLQERGFSTSICGGFEIEYIDSEMRIRMMKPFVMERGE